MRNCFLSLLPLAAIVRMKRARPPFEAAIDGLGHAESLFDPFAVLDRQGVTLVPGRAAVDR